MEKHKYLTGDIISATAAPPTTGLLGHKGIAVVDNNEIYIYHNTPLENNEWGGSTIKDTLYNFKSPGRKIKSIDRSNTTKPEIEVRFEQIKHKKFRWLTWNCDHAIDYLLSGEEKSSQLRKILIVGILFLSFFAIRKYKFK